MENTATNISSFPTSDMASETSLNQGRSADAINKAASSAHGAVDSAAGKAKPAIDKAAQFAHQTVDKAAGAAAPAAEWITEKTEALKVTQKQVLDDTCNYVSANPLKAVGIAAALGFVIGRLAA
jgi:ElaB/YqjD/DUF883 family membrane-anchored ribosome-binding protein